MKISALILFGCLILSSKFLKLSASDVKVTESNPCFSKGERLLEWNRQKLTSQSDLSINDIKELFAPEFVVMANGRKYDANYQNYYEFLNKFRINIETIDYEVQEYISMESTVVMPLKATVKYLQGTIEVFDAIMLIKFDNSGKIIHWQEVYSKR